MRIRKLFHLSSLSDPQVFNRSSSMVQHHHHHLHLLTKTHQQQNEGLAPSQQSDPPIQTIGSLCSDSNRKKLEAEEDEELEKKTKSTTNDSFRQGIIRSAGTSTTGSLPQPAHSSNQFVGRWREADKIYPPKKRRMNFLMTSSISSSSSSSDEEQGDQTKPTTMSSKTNKKCEAPKTGDEKELITADKKKPKRGNVIMEGSRCSRVNGRGWRCCQPTLVGYSLCEHHLGKGRLRSMQSKGGSRKLSTSKPVVREKRLMEIMLEKEDEDDKMEGEGKKKKMQMVTKKRVRLGAVKARSLSSLLAQEDTAVLVVSHSNGGE